MASLTIAPPSASAITTTYSSRQRRIAMLVVASAFVIDLMDATILTIALPTIQAHMHAGLAAVNWMATAYPLALAVFLITGGRLGDVVGYRRMFVVGVLAFGIASVLVGAAWTPGALIAARLLQGTAAAMMVPQVLSMVQVLYQAEERTAVAGMLAGLTMLSTTAAPIVTAVLIRADLFGLSWRPIFLINVPVCLAALPLAARYLPPGGSTGKRRVDAPGTLLGVLTMLLVVFPLIEGRTLGWPSWCFAMLAAAAPTFGLFVWRQHRTAARGFPLVSPELFRHRPFGVGLAVSLLVTAAVACFGLTFSLLLQSGHHFTAIHAVLTALFLTLGMVGVAGPLSRKIIPAIGRWSLTAGLVVMAGGIAAVVASLSAAHLSTWHLAPALCLLGAGMGLTFTPLLPFILAEVGPGETGAASGVANAVQQLGSALGVAVLGAVFFDRLAATASYEHAFRAVALPEVILLACAAVLTLALPRRISPASYRPTI